MICLILALTASLHANSEVCCEISDRPTEVGGLCREGCGCCPDGTWAGSIGDGKTFSCGDELLSGDELGPICDDSVVCAADVFECPDGSYLARDAENDCRFPPCQNGTPGCPRDALECPDGTIVRRDPRAGCEFPLCQNINVAACDTDVFECPDGDIVTRDPNNDCEFPSCAVTIGCTEELKVCPDGTSVSRDPDLDCEFIPCGERPDVACTQDVFNCPDGTYVSRDPANDCKFPPCSNCDTDSFECPNGDVVTRNSENGCEFDSCGVTITCAADAKQCADGSSVEPDKNCNFAPCPNEFGLQNTSSVALHCDKTTTLILTFILATSVLW